MTLLAVATVLLVVVAAVAAVYVARGAVAIVAIHRQLLERQVAFDKETKAILTRVQRTEATAKRILERQYEFARQADTVLMDPKVQAALSKAQRESG